MSLFQKDLDQKFLGFRENFVSFWIFGIFFNFVSIMKHLRELESEYKIHVCLTYYFRDSLKASYALFWIILPMKQGSVVWNVPLVGPRYTGWFCVSTRHTIELLQRKEPRLRKHLHEIQL